MKIAYQCNNYEVFKQLYEKYVVAGNPQISWDYGFTCITEDGYCGSYEFISKVYETKERA